MSRRLLLFAALFGVLALGVIWDRANVAVGRSSPRGMTERSGAAQSVHEPSDPDELVVVVGGRHDREDADVSARHKPSPGSPARRGESIEPSRRPAPEATPSPGSSAVPEPERTYRVQAGDTLRSIAARSLGD